MILQENFTLVKVQLKYLIVFVICSTGDTHRQVLTQKSETKEMIPHTTVVCHS